MWRAFVKLRVELAEPAEPVEPVELWAELRAPPTKFFPQSSKLYIGIVLLSLKIYRRK